jgi:hypothetical protein
MPVLVASRNKAGSLPYISPDISNDDGFSDPILKRRLSYQAKLSRF